jgi:hypothetical protein
MSLSLVGTLRSCKVDSAQANRIESARFLNPAEMICPVWNGYNNKGQSVLSDTEYTKSAGCNSAMDRVYVENNLRPNYAAFINLNMNGLSGDIYGDTEIVNVEAGSANQWQNERYNIGPSFGNQWQSTNYQTCSLTPYADAMASEEARQQLYANSAYNSQYYRNAAGTY